MNMTNDISLEERAKWQVPAMDTPLWLGKQHSYCVVIPVINEGERIKSLLKKMEANGIDSIADVIIVDGGSTDGSLELDELKKVGVRGLVVKKGPGKLSAQLRCAYAFALDQGYDGIVTIDGNDKDNPEAIPRFIEALESGIDFVQASRFLPGGVAVNTPRSRDFAIRHIHAPCLSVASGFKWTDTTQGFRAYSRRMLLDPQIAPFCDVFSTYELLAYLSYRAPKLGYVCKELPTIRRYPVGEIPTKISNVRGNAAVFNILLQACMGRYNTENRRKSNINKKSHSMLNIRKLFLYSLFVWISFLLVPQGVQPIGGSGSGQGKFEDRADSFSEHIVRNTVMNNIAGLENRGWLPVLISGHANGDYGFRITSSGTYFSHLVFQSAILTKAAKLLQIDNDKGFHWLFRTARAINAALLAFFTVATALMLTSAWKLNNDWIIPVFFSSSTGWLLFSQNLYHMLWLGWMVTAFVTYSTLNDLGKHKTLLISTTLSTIVFLRGYEFATVFCLISSGLAFILQKEHELKDRVIAFFETFLSIFLGFIIALTIHSFAITSQIDISFSDSLDKILASTKLRLQSMTYVQWPLSSEFYAHLNSVWNESGLTFSSKHFLSKGFMLFAAIGLILIFNNLLKERSSIYSAIILAMIAYSSWYIAAYQHIMYHYFFDTIIFANTIGFFSIFPAMHLLQVFRKKIDELRSAPK